MLLETTAFLCGMAMMIIELLGARLISPIFGNSFFIWTGVIGVVLTSMSLGYWRGGVLADRDKSIAELSRRIFLAGIATALVPPLILFFGALFLPTIGWQWGAVATALWSLSMPCYWLAMVSPYCIRLAERGSETIGKVSGRLYAISTVGSIIGVFLAGFVLIPYFSVRLSMYLLGSGLMILAAALHYRSNERTFVRKASAATMILAATMLAPLLAAGTPPFVPDIQGSNKTVLASGESMYNSITVVETDLPAGRYRLMTLGRLVQGGLNVDTNGSYYRYADYIDSLWSVKPDIMDVLVLGNGAAVTVSEIRENHPAARIDAVDIDREVFDYASAYFDEREDERTRFIVDDARVYLQKTGKKYDLIVMDIFGATHIVPFHITTREMQESISDHLNPDGIYVMNLVSATEGPRSRLFKSQLKTLDTVFPKNYVIQVDDPAKVNTVLLLSGKDGLDANALEASEALKTRLRRSSEYDTSDGIVLTDDYAPVDDML
jgi:spermidine synthase